ncbi:MAG: SAM-dependent methyltransferase [Chloroflexia bacterium]
MDLATFRALLTGTGQAALAAAEALLRDGTTDLAALTRLRARFPVPLAAAAFDQATLRRRAKAGGSSPRRRRCTFRAMGWSRQRARGSRATGRGASRRSGWWRIWRAASVGIALALAAGHSVLAVDRDLLRLALARENARAYGVAGRLLPVCADLTALPTPRADALFCDPGRRTAEGRRIFSPEGYQPPLSLVATWRGVVPALGVKDCRRGSTGSSSRPPTRRRWSSSRRGDAEGGGLLVWAAADDRAAGDGVAGGATLAADGGVSGIPITLPDAVLYEPDPAVIRAGLVEHLARDLGAAKIDREIAYLTADQAVATPFARAYRVIESFPFGLKRLKRALRALMRGS